jgi:methyl-accepting chemotaxis protein
MHSISAVVEEGSAATEEIAVQVSVVTGSIQSIAGVLQEQSSAEKPLRRVA